MNAADQGLLLDHELAHLRLSQRARRACTALGLTTVRHFLLLPRATFVAAATNGPRVHRELERRIAAWLQRGLGGPAVADDRPILPLVTSGAAARAMHQLGIRTVGEFLAAPRERLLACPGVGQRTLDKIARAAARTAPLPTFGSALLPDTLRTLPLRHAALPAALLARFEDLGCRTVGHALALPASAWSEGGTPGPAAAAALRDSLDQLFRAALEQIDTRPADGALDWPMLRGRLLAPLDEGDRDLFCHRIGLRVPVRSAREQAQATGRSLEAVQAQEEAIRARLHARAPSVMCRLKHEAARELEAFEGVLRGDRLAVGTLLHTAAKGSGDRELPLRLLAFCFPADYCDHGGFLSALPPAARLNFARELRALTAPRLLPRPLDELARQLRAVADPVPRGLLLHMLAERCRVRVHIDPARGELVLPAQPQVSVRLAELLHEEGRPTQLCDLVFHYRERFHAASQKRLLAHLRREPAFVEIGPDVWSLRCWHDDELAAAVPRAEAVVAAVCERGGRHKVENLLGEADQRTRHLVLDLARRDARLRWLGRGEVCPAGHAQSHALETLLADFRQAAGEVVYSRFVDNQPAEHRRLVERLLCENRLFVFPAHDRIDVLTNYPFNQERLGRLVQLVDEFLRARNGYAPLGAVLDEVNRCDLGGGWLTPTLLGELLRRHAPFEVLPGGYVARGELGLGGWLMRRARNALREATVPISVQEILAERPELGEFAGCLEDLLKQDPLVQTPDGLRFQIA